MSFISPFASCIASSSRSAIGPRGQIASSFRGIHHSATSSARSRTPNSNRSNIQASRSCLSTSTIKSQRQVLGRIIPKRIAVALPPGTSAAEVAALRSAGGGPGGAGALPKASIWRPIVFCILFGGAGYAGAAAYTNRDTAQWAGRLGGGSWWRKGKEQPTDREIARAKTLDGAKQAQQTVNALRNTLSFLPNLILVPILRVYVLLAEYQLNTPPAQLAPVGIITVMGGVFLAWKVKRFEPFMRTWFLHRPVLFGGGVRREWANCLTMFTSTISHQSLAHFGFNSFALFSFGAATYSFLSLPIVTPNSSGMSSSTHIPHFAAFLFTAGLFSSLSSHLWSNLVRLPKFLRTLASPGRLSSPQALAAHYQIMPSLGASGAIYAALALTACAFPESNVGIIFIPFVSIPIGYGVAGMVGLDLIGLIAGWRMFDHVAHLSGALFGFIYYGYGRQAWAWVRKQLGGREKNAGFK